MATPCIAAAPCGCMTECEKSNAEAVPRVPPSELTAVPASLSATEVAYVDAYPPPVLDGRGGFTGDAFREGWLPPRPEGLRCCCCCCCSAASASVRPCPEFSGEALTEFWLLV